MTWKTLKNFTKYKISDEGKVINNTTNKEVKGSISQDYIRVALYPDTGKKKPLRLHRVVATLFCHKPDKCNVVNHINGIKTDNRVCNLEVVTNRENSSTCKRVYSDIKKLVGVIYKENRFCAKLSINTKEVFLGSYYTLRNQQERFITY